MENNAIKLKYNISPKAYADFLFAKNEGIDVNYTLKRMLMVEFYRLSRFPQCFDKPYVFINDDNIVFLLNSDKEIGRNSHKDYIKIGDLPLSFFDDVAKEFCYPFALRTDYANKVDVLISEYFKFVAKNLLQQIPFGALKFPLRGAVSLNLQVITYNEFKDTRHYKKEKKEYAFGEFFRVARELFRSQDFFLEIGAERGITQILLWDCRLKEAVAYDILSYTSDSFDFLDGKDKRLQKLFVRMYFEHLLQVNLKQILKGVEQ